VYVDNQVPYRIYGAQQDNSTLILPSLPVTSGGLDDPVQGWQTGPGCETGPILPHPTNPDTVYGSCKGQYSRMSMRTGQEKHYWIGAQSLYGNAMKDMIFRFQRVSPMEYSPQRAQRHALLRLAVRAPHARRRGDVGGDLALISRGTLRSDSRRASGGPITIDVTGEEYFSVVYAIRESVLERGVIWTGANDGPFYMTRDNGRTWQDITPLVATSGLHEAQGAAACRKQIEPSPHRRGSAYYTVLRYLLGDFTSRSCIKTDDYGARRGRCSRRGPTASRPTSPFAWCARIRRGGAAVRRHRVRAYISFTTAGQWQSLQLNLPNTPITDMKRAAAATSCSRRRGARSGSCTTSRRCTR
jgi:hypothetical protein